MEIPDAGEEWALGAGISAWLLAAPGDFNDRMIPLVRAMLTVREQEQWYQLESRAIPKRRRQWLLGRWAAKVACRNWFRGHGKVSPDWMDVEIRTLETGQPYIELPRLGARMRLSIAHTDSHALAACAQIPLGVDVEPIGRLLGADARTFSAQIFSDDELQHLPPPDDTLWARSAIRAWCAKEAAAKLVGTGFQGRPKRFRILQVKADKATVSYEGGACRIRLDQRFGMQLALAVQGAATQEPERAPQILDALQT
jgi:phosphopantetheinyl transferase (holo-ACP synthase)